MHLSSVLLLSLIMRTNYMFYGNDIILLQWIICLNFCVYWIYCSGLVFCFHLHFSLFFFPILRGNRYVVLTTICYSPSVPGFCTTLQYLVLAIPFCSLSCLLPDKFCFCGSVCSFISCNWVLFYLVHSASLLDATSCLYYSLHVSLLVVC